MEVREADCSKQVGKVYVYPSEAFRPGAPEPVAINPWITDPAVRQEIQLCSGGTNNDKDVCAIVQSSLLTTFTTYYRLLLFTSPHTKQLATTEICYYPQPLLS